MEHLLAPLPTRGRTCSEDIEHNRVKIVYIKENHRIYGGFCSFGGDGESPLSTFISLNGSTVVDDAFD